MRDEGCPTCGSANIGVLEIKKSELGPSWKMQCYNCKKAWFETK